MAQQKREKLNERPSGIHTAPSLQGSIQNHLESSPNTKLQEEIPLY
jgi:hypothetical protein